MASGGGWGWSPQRRRGYSIGVGACTLVVVTFEAHGVANLHGPGCVPSAPRERAAAPTPLPLLHRTLLGCSTACATHGADSHKGTPPLCVGLCAVRGSRVRKPTTGAKTPRNHWRHAWCTVPAAARLNSAPLSDLASCAQDDAACGVCARRIDPSILAALACRAHDATCGVCASTVVLHCRPDNAMLRIRRSPRHPANLSTATLPSHASRMAQRRP